MRKPYGRLTITLPTFMIIGLREMIAEVNAERPEKEPRTVSLLLERWLMRAFGQEELRHWKRVASRSPEFVTAAEEWLRWTDAEARRERTRKAAKQ